MFEAKGLGFRVKGLGLRVYCFGFGCSNNEVCFAGFLGRSNGRKHSRSKPGTGFLLLHKNCFRFFMP